MKEPRFRVAPGPHAPQLAIQAHDLSEAECHLVRGVVTNNYMPSDEYGLAKAAGVFLQGFELPQDGRKDGWALVEFWTSDRGAIDAFVTHLNGRMERDLGPKRQTRGMER